MATCKDCVHFEACKNIYEIHGDGLSEESYGCDQFSNRSRFVELPCNPGDVLYLVDEYKIIKLIVNRVIVSVYKGIGVRAVDKLSDITYGFVDQRDFGSIVFFTREEAEKVLKEREENA